MKEMKSVMTKKKKKKKKKNHFKIYVCMNEKKNPY